MTKAVGLTKNHRRVCWKVGVHNGASKHHLGINFSPGQASMSCGTSRYQLSNVTKFVYEEDTEYVALEVDPSKSGWPTMYETLHSMLIIIHKHDVIRYVLRALSKVEMMVAWWK